MANDVNMYYRFTSDEEPTEEQLLRLMEEVRDEVRRKNANLDAIIMENIRKECENVKKLFPNA
jgi:hypothetical protein